MKDLDCEDSLNEIVSFFNRKINTVDISIETNCRDEWAEDSIVESILELVNSNKNELETLAMKKLLEHARKEEKGFKSALLGQQKIISEIERCLNNS